VTLHLTDRSHDEPTRAAWPSTQFVYGGSDAVRYETPARDEVVSNPRLLVSPELALFQRMIGFTSVPSSTPISASIITRSGAFNLRFSEWVGTSVATLRPIEPGESPFSSWPILDAIRRSGHPEPSFSWPRFLARLSLLAIDETPTSTAWEITNQPHPAQLDVAERDDVMAAIAAVQAVLDLTTEELSAATGVGLRTLRRWKSRPVRPRRHTARAVWRLYVAARALQKGLGVQGVATWLHVGTPSPMDLLAAGDLATFEQLARSRILTGERESRPYAGFAEELPGENATEPGQFRRASRRPTHGRLRAR
jgi:hypothetical protein